MPLNDVNTTLGALLGSSYVNDFNRFGRVYKVYMQAEPEFRRDPKQIGLFFVKNAQGGMVPLDTLVSTRPTQGPEFTNRFNLFRSAELTGVPAAGFSSTQALDALEATAREVLPPDMSFDWADMSYQERRAPGVAVVFALAIFLVFLILAAQYESWGLPFSVLLGTPFAVFGAYLGLYLARTFMGPSYVNNVFAQIGLIMLIGLAAKNAILIVEFAKMEHDKGMPLVESALLAAKLRFRPILMTAFAFILGVVPLLTAAGAGAEGRKVMGMAVFAGMLVATILGVLPHPDALRGRDEGHRRHEEGAGPAGARRPPWRPSTDREGTEMRRPSFRALAATIALSSALWPAAPSAENYERPQMPSPDQFRFVDGPAQAQTLADAPWFDVFQDPELQALIKEALGNNLDLQAALARVEEARARAGIAKSFYYPQVDGQFNAGWRGSSSDDDNRSRVGDRERELRVRAVLGNRPVRQAAAAAGISAGHRARQRAEPARRAGHPDRRRRVHILPAARVRSADRHRAADPGA